MPKILITGDYCPIERIESLSVAGDHNAIFNDFLPYIQEADIAATNLECPLIDNASPIKKTGPALKAPAKAINALQSAGFNLATLSNNHIMDYGVEGLNSTIEQCRQNNIAVVGAGQNLDEARKIFYSTIDNKRIAILNFSENEFNTTNGNYPGSNPLSLIQNYNDIKQAKANADFVLVIFHGGNEMHPLPSPRIKETFRFYADAGANCVIGHHTHCYSGYETYNGTKIFYGLGNFVFDYSKIKNKIWDEGYAVMITLDESPEAVYEVIPYVQNAKAVGVRLMTAEEHNDFTKNIDQLNSIIQDDELLEKKFNEFISSKRAQYENYLEPVSNTILSALVRKKILPSFLKKNKRMLYLNLIRCEAHKDVILKLLKDDYSNTPQ